MRVLLYAGRHDLPFCLSDGYFAESCVEFDSDETARCKIQINGERVDFSEHYMFALLKGLEGMATPLLAHVSLGQVKQGGGFVVLGRWWINFTSLPGEIEEGDQLAGTRIDTRDLQLLWKTTDNIREPLELLSEKDREKLLAMKTDDQVVFWQDFFKIELKKTVSLRLAAAIRALEIATEKVTASAEAFQLICE